jgi:hypothetical protein
VAPHQHTKNLAAGKPIGTVEVRLAAEFIERFGRARNYSEIQSSWHEICRWSSFRDPGGKPVNSDTDAVIAWRWLIRVAYVAKERDDITLPSQVLGCARYWDWCALQYAEVGDFVAVVQLPTAERDIKIQLAAIALPCLLALPADLRLMNGQAGPYTTSGLAMYAVNLILSYNERYSLPLSPELDSFITPELAALARDVWAGRVNHAKWT